MPQPQEAGRVTDTDSHALFYCFSASESADSFKIMPYDIFISYSSKDLSIARRIVEALEERNYKCWYAKRDIATGIPYARAIMQGIEQCPYFLVILTENSVKSENVINEVENAHNLHKRILPVFLTDLTLPGELNFYLRRLHWATLDDNKTNNILSILGLEDRGPVVVKVDGINNEKKATEGNNERTQKPAEHNPGHQSSEPRGSQKSSIKKLFQNFRALCRSLTDKLSSFFNWIPKRMWYIIGILICVAVVVSIIVLKRPKNLEDPKIEVTQQDSIPQKKSELISGTKIYADTLVDLGLSVLWASQNIGANAPSENGAYFKWGDKNPSNPKISDKTYINVPDDNIAGNTTYDPATSVTLYSTPVRLPLMDEFIELMNNCKWTWTDSKIDDKRIVGYIVTGTTGNSIFLPAAGRYYAGSGIEIPAYGSASGNYWSATSHGGYASQFYMRKNEINKARNLRSFLMSVRPVADK